MKKFSTIPRFLTIVLTIPSLLSIVLIPLNVLSSPRLTKITMRPLSIRILTEPAEIPP